MIGLILWAILIFWIACAACPGFFTMICTILGVIFGIFILLCIIGMFCGEPYPDMKETPKDREKAIDEWEKYTGRTHPTRMNKKY